MREELLLHRLKLMLAVIIAMMLCGALLTTAGVEWGVIAGIAGLAAALPAPALWLLLAGGIAYTVGIVFFALGKKMRWFHPVWHLFDIAGTALQFASILLLLL